MVDAKNSSKHNIVLVFGSVRTDRQGFPIVSYLEKKLKERKHRVIIVDPRKYKIPLLQKRYREYPKGKLPKNLQEISNIFQTADAIIVISAEYNHSIPPALSNTLNHFVEEYKHKPSAIVCYSGGHFGGVRASMQLRQMLPELGMPTIPMILPIPKVQESFDKKGNPTNEFIEKGTNSFLDQLHWYTEAFKQQSKKGLLK